jgi:hypothetical protein
MPRCAVAPAKLCVIAEQSDDGQPIVFTAFDANGRGKELAKLDTQPGGGYNWAVSLDGTRIAVLETSTMKIRIFFLANRTLKQVEVKGFQRLERIYWTADGKGWFISGSSEHVWNLLHVDLQGNATRLWHPPERGALVFGIPSPDGRHLAIIAYAINKNIWMMQDK